MWESLNSLWSAVQSGVNLVYHAAGWLDGGLIASYEKFVMDCEVLQQFQRYFEPALTDTSPDALAVDAIAAVGPHSHFFGAEHTQSRYTSAFYAPFLSDWRNYEAWTEAGSPHHRAARQPHLEGDPRRVRAAAHGRRHPRGARRLRRPPQARGRRADGLLTSAARRAPFRRNVREETETCEPHFSPPLRSRALAAGAASAQTAPAPAPAPAGRRAPAPAPDWTQGWSGQATLYVWLPAINGSQEGPDGEPLVNLDTVDVLSRPRHGLHGLGAVPEGQVRHPARRRLRQARAPTAPGCRTGSSTETETKLGFYTAALSYRVYDDPKGFVDVYGGARYFDTTVEFKIGTANLGEASFSKSLNWTDAIIGVRGGVTLNDRWSLAGFADYGGFDGAKDQSWEVYGGANYAFSDRWQGTLGYRYVSIQKEVTDRASLDIDIQGPLLGVTYKF